MSHVSVGYGHAPSCLLGSTHRGIFGTFHGSSSRTASLWGLRRCSRCGRYALRPSDAAFESGIASNAFYQDFNLRFS